MSLWSEINRRGVLRVGLAYLAGVWLLLQVASVVLPSFEFPSWIMQALILASAFGFPIALLFAWFYDWTPDGIRAASKLESAKAVGFTGRKLDFVIIGLLVLAVGFLIVEKEVMEDDVSVLPNSIAVLPFENLSPDPNDAFFATGIHGELLSQLAMVGDLNVIARTTVMQFDETRPLISDVAQALKVGTVMEGSVRYAGERVRVSAQLIDARTNTQLWANVYERGLEDIFAIQADIAKSIAAELHAELTTAETRSIDKKLTNSPEAYALYLQGLAAYPENPTVVRFMDEAVALDPNFSMAYARKAWAHVRYAQSVTGVLEDPEARNEHAAIAREAAEKALTLDPNLGYAHAQLARVNLYELRWSEARQALERALLLSPNDPSVLMANALQMANAGEQAEARELAEHALALDPGSRSVQHGLVPIVLGDWDAAYTALQRIIALPGQPQAFAYLELGYAEGARGNTVTAIEAVRIAEQIAADDTRPSWLARVARSYARAGSDGDALRVVSQIREIAIDDFVSATTWYVAHSAIADYEEAIKWLHTAIRTRDTYGDSFRELQTRNDHIDQLWQNERFQEARELLGFNGDDVDR